MQQQANHLIDELEREEEILHDQLSEVQQNASSVVGSDAIW